jgi:hypothetical protein
MGEIYMLLNLALDGFADFSCRGRVAIQARRSELRDGDRFAPCRTGRKSSTTNLSFSGNCVDVDGVGAIRQLRLTLGF